MYILLISRGTPTKKHPIKGIFEFQQAQALQRAGHKVIIACIENSINYRDHCFFSFLRNDGIIKEYKDGVQVYTGMGIIPFPWRLCVITGKKKYPTFVTNAYVRVFEKIVSKHGAPDVIYSHYLTESFHAAIIGEKYNIPVVGVEHWSELAKPVINPMIKQLVDRTYPKLDKLICVSEPLSQRIKETFGVDSEVVHNIVDIDYTPRIKKTVSEQTIKMVTIGRLSPQKKFDTIIQALAKKELRNEDWELKIVGSGILEKSLKQLVAKVGLEGKIHFTGQKTHDEVCQILSESDFFVLASEYETFGVVFIEAMSFGLPVIGTICGGPEVIINENNGLLVPNNNVDAMAEAIKKMMSTYKNYSSEAIMAEAKAKYSPSAIVPKIERVLAEAIKNHKS